MSVEKQKASEDLAARIREAQSKYRTDDVPEREPVQKQAMKMGLDLVAGTLVGVVLGLALDKWLGTVPLFLIVFLMLGVAAGLRNSFRELKRFQSAEAGAQASDSGKDQQTEE